MFNKLVAIEPVSLIPSAEEALHQYAKEVVLYRDIPASDDQIVQRIGNADAVLLSYTSRMGKNVIERCPNIRYIGMCCSLYSEESANVDIALRPTPAQGASATRPYGRSTCSPIRKRPLCSPAMPSRPLPPSRAGST